MLIWPQREQPNHLVMFPFCLPPRVPLALLDPPWSNSLLWGSWVVRRILVHWVIVSLILAPCRARGSTAAVRRILVMSPEFSHHQRRVVLVFTRVQMCGHLPLVRSIKCPCWEISGIYGHPLSKPVSFLPWCYFHHWDNMTWSMMPFGLVWVGTPFNPTKS